MTIRKLLTTATVILSLVAGNAFAASTKAEKQAEIRAATQTSVAKFIKADPKLQDQMHKAPGYAVFTTFGLSFIVGGAGGKGLVHENKTKQDVFMEMAQASAGPQVGISENETLIIFKTDKGMQEFIAKGWSASTGGAVQAGAAGKSAGPATGALENLDAGYYTLTKNGLSVGIVAAGTKFWKDSDLN